MSRDAPANPAQLNETAREILAGLVNADFSALADSFANAGFAVCVPARGILQIRAAAAPASRRRLLLSVGIHGDETAPIEILAHLLAHLTQAPHVLRVDLMLVVGNPAAIAQGKRYIEADLNRQFESRPSMAGETAEAQRAGQIMRATQQFFTTGKGEGERESEIWHLDLHTAIRSSHYPSFAIVPEQVTGAARQALLDWLAAAGTDAAVLSPKSSGTYSAYTALKFGAIACTAELGRVARLGANDLSSFASAQAALLAMLTGGVTVPGTPPLLFSVAQELTKFSEAFTLAIADSTGNFTAMAQGALIATDGEHVYRVAAETEYVLFPNAAVAIGHRAGLMVVRHGAP